MPKRNAEEKLEHYRKKLKKLEEKEVLRRRRKRFHSSDEENQDVTELIPHSEYRGEDTINEQPVEVVTIPGPPDEPPNEPQVETTAESQAEPQTQQQTVTTDLECIGTDPVLLSALGASISDTPEFGDKINENVALLWPPILKKGLSKEEKEQIMKNYLPPDNCRLIQAPKLNAEISAAVCDTSRFRDKKIQNFQQQLGAGLTAINKAINIMVSPTEDKVQSLKHLSDGCRILSDLHYLFTKDRTKLILPSLDKNFLHVLNETERDETLFGNTLSDKIKASKVIERQSHQIKKTASKTSTVTSATITRPAQGNWSGPHRYQASRGGRGGPNRAPMTRAPPPRRNYQNTFKSQSQLRPRAPQQ